MPGLMPVNFTVTGVSNRLITGNGRPLSNWNARSRKSAAMDRFERIGAAARIPCGIFIGGREISTAAEGAMRPVPVQAANKNASAQSATGIFTSPNVRPGPEARLAT